MNKAYNISQLISFKLNFIWESDKFLIVAVSVFLIAVPLFQYCLMEHFYNNPLSKLCCTEKQLNEVTRGLDKTDLNNVGEVMSFRTYMEKLPPNKAEKVLTNDKVFKVIKLQCIQDVVLMDRY